MLNGVTDRRESGSLLELSRSRTILIYGLVFLLLIFIQLFWVLVFVENIFIFAGSFNILKYSRVP